MILLSSKFLKQNVTYYQRASIVENLFWVKALATPSNKMTDKCYYVRRKVNNIKYSRENLKKHEIYIADFSSTIDMAALASI